MIQKQINISDIWAENIDDMITLNINYTGISKYKWFKNEWIQMVQESEYRWYKSEQIQII